MEKPDFTLYSEMLISYREESMKKNGVNGPFMQCVPITDV